MIAWAVILTISIFACAGIYQIMKDRGTKPSAKAYVHPLSEDDMALWRHALEIEAMKVAGLRSTRQASAKTYELFTYPGISWEYRKQRVINNLKNRSAHLRERTHQSSEGAASR